MKVKSLVDKLPRVIIGSVVLYCLVLSVWPSASRIKDIAAFQGVKENPLMGYGLVVGLDGSGDSRQTRFTTQTLANLLNLEGIVVSPQSIQIKNTAAVMVTTKLPPFAPFGSTIDLTVSSIGDARGLQGGVLLMTPLKAANGQVYAVGQGAVSIGGFAVRTGSSAVQKNQPTVGRIPGGGIVEREVSFSLQGRDRPATSDNPSIRVPLHGSPPSRTRHREYRFLF